MSKKYAAQRDQLETQRRKVDFDSYDITVDELIRRVSRQRIEIAPAYQRQFRWDEKRQSLLIESLLLGIPVPPLFMATNIEPLEGTRWEVVDGLQRLLTLVNFVAPDEVREAVAPKNSRLTLRGLEKLSEFEGTTFSALPQDIKDSLEDRPLKVIVLNDKSDLQVRFDLFERLNTGGVELTDHEVRECVYIGEFVNLLVELSETEVFKKVVRLPAAKQKDGTAQEFVLRFFAFVENYSSFEHSVKDFLNEHCALGAKSPQLDQRKSVFFKTFNFLAEVFPDGIKLRQRTTPVNLFEGISAGAALALQQNPELSAPRSLDWVSSDDLRRATIGATNNKSSVRSRIEISREHFLAGQ